MKQAQKFGWLVATMLFCGTTTSLFAQTIKDVFNNSESPLFYLGIDFTKAKLIDDATANATIFATGNMPASMNW